MSEQDRSIVEQAMRNVDLPPQVEKLLRWWWQRARDILGPEGRSVMVNGSVVLGDFAPGWSDVDVCVAVDSPVTESQGEELGELHAEMHRRFVEKHGDGWQSGQVVEGAYIPVSLLPDLSGDDACFVSMGGTREWTNGVPHRPFDRYMLSHHVACYWGEAVSFASPALEELAEQSREDLRMLTDLAAGDRHSAIWLAGMIHWVARSIVFWREGEMLGKGQALQREIDRGSPFSEAYRLALRLRQEGSAAAAGYLNELRRHIETIRKPAAEVFRELLSGGR